VCGGHWRRTAKMRTTCAPHLRAEGLLDRGDRRQEGEGAGIKSVTVGWTARTCTGCSDREVGCTGWCAFRVRRQCPPAHLVRLGVRVIRRSTRSDQIEIKPEDLRVDTFARAGRAVSTSIGPDSAVRMVQSAHQHRGAVPERAVAAQEPRRWREATRARAVRVRAGKEAGGGTQSRGHQADINFGSQIRSYVLAPYRLIKDHRTKLGVGDVDRVLDGDLDELMHAWLVYSIPESWPEMVRKRSPIEAADSPAARADPAGGGFDPGGKLVAFPRKRCTDWRGRLERPWR